MPQSDPDTDALSGLDGGDRLFEHRVRLAVAILLSRHDALSFRRLKDLTGETDGSLGAHLRRLEDAGYVGVRKEFLQRKPVSWYTITGDGRRALAAHVRALEELLATLNDGGQG